MARKHPLRFIILAQNGRQKLVNLYGLDHHA